MLLGRFDSQQVMKNKMEIENWERNKVFEEVKNMGQKAVNT